MWINNAKDEIELVHYWYRQLDTRTHTRTLIIDRATARVRSAAAHTVLRLPTLQECHEKAKIYRQGFTELGRPPEAWPAVSEGDARPGEV